MSRELISNLDTRLDNLPAPKPILGSVAQVLLFSGTNTVTPDYMCKAIQVVDNASDAEYAKQKGEDFQRVFDTYQRVSIHSSKPESDVALPNELTTWKLIGGRIQCTLNTSGQVGFVAPDSYENYEFIVNLFSPGSDDDWIGMILGHYKDANGKLHNLTYSRHKQGASAGARLDYNWTGARAKGLLYKQRNPLENGGWSSHAAGCRVRVKREGSLLICDSTLCYTTVAARDAAAYEPFYHMEYDLASTETGRLFLGPQRYGYMAHSQDAATYDVISKPGGTAPILDTSSNTLHVKVGDAWVIKPLSEVLTTGIFYNDVISGRFFHFNGNRLREFT